MTGQENDDRTVLQIPFASIAVVLNLDVDLEISHLFLFPLIIGTRSYDNPSQNLKYDQNWKYYAMESGQFLNNFKVQRQKVVCHLLFQMHINKTPGPHPHLPTPSMSGMMLKMNKQERNGGGKLLGQLSVAEHSPRTLSKNNLVKCGQRTIDLGFSLNICSSDQSGISRKTRS